jgi:hypothetical protein
MKTIAVLIEKVVWTYIQTLLILVLAGDSLNIDFTTELAVAALPAALTVLANGLPAVPVGLPLAVDLVLRVIRSFAATFLGTLLAMPVFTLDMSSGRAAALAGGVSVLVVLKGFVASRLGALNTAATLPASLDPSSSGNIIELAA